jgi:hypothetical protein
MDPDLKKVEMPSIMNVSIKIKADDRKPTLLMWVIVDYGSHKAKAYRCEVESLILKIFNLSEWLIFAIFKC